MSKNVKLAKRILSVILSMALLLGELPSLGQKALADEPAPAADAHIHCVCGESSCSGEEHSAPQVWTEWTDGTSLPSTAGYYYLGTDVTLSTWWQPADGMYLCLNGHVITADCANSYAIYVQSRRTFTLTECDTVTSHAFAVESNGRWTLDEKNGTESVVGGVITSSDGGNGAVTIGGGTFMMYGGNLCGNHSDKGAAIANSGTVKMYGGAICGNGGKQTGAEGGAVYNAGVAAFTMYGGEIYSNHGWQGGGIYSKGTVQLNGGRIYNNTAYYGGGICNEGTLVMNESEICDNSSWYEGGGILIRQTGSAVIYGGTITGNLSGKYGGGICVDGSLELAKNPEIQSPVIWGNRSDCALADNYTLSGGVAGNVYLASGKTIKVSGALDERAAIGVTMSQTVGTFAKPDGTNLTSLAAYADSFASDRGYAVSVSGATNLILEYTVAQDHRHCACGGDMCDSHMTKTWTEWTSATTLPSTPGYYYLSTDVTLNQYWDAVDGTYLCLNGYVVTSKKYGAIRTNTGNTLTLTDCDTTTTHKFTVKSTGVWVLDETNGTETLTGGVITGCDATVGAVVANGTITMYGGNIVGNTTGGGVRAGGTFLLKGGTIAGNKSNSNGGGVTVNTSGTMEMTGGQILQNVGTYAGGVDNEGTFTMTGGQIRANKSTYYGSGVSVGSSVNSAVFTMSGGEIIENILAVATFGGAVYVWENAEVNLSGTPVIRDNVKGSSYYNVYLRSGACLMVADALEAGAEIGVSMQDVTGIFAKPDGTNVTDLTPYADRFYSDADYLIMAESGNLLLGKAPAEHVHCVCGSITCSGGDHDASAEWVKWTDSTSLPTEKGNYYLDTDVMLSTTWAPAAGTNLCLHGHVVTSASGSVIMVNQWTRFIVTDCDSTTTHRFSVEDNGAWTLNEENGTETVTGGVILSGDGSAVVDIVYRGALHLYAGNICGGKTNGGVLVKGTFYTYGGQVCGNASESNGGGVNVESGGVMHLSGGQIVANTAENKGGGIYVYGTLNMTGGTIRNNIGKFEGGGLDVVGIVNMSGGQIIENTANVSGGAGAFIQFGGQMNVSGMPVIRQNATDSGAPSNVFMMSDVSLTVNGALEAGASIGVGSFAEFAVVAVPDGTNVTDLTGYETYFISDDDDYMIQAKDGNLVLAEAVVLHEHCVCGVVDCEDDEHGGEQVWTEWTGSTSLPASAGYYYLSTDVTLSATWDPKNGTYLCLNGHVVTGADDYVIFVGVEFVLADCETEKTHAFSVGNDGLWILDEENGTETVDGGVITGGTTGIYVQGPFSMYGGNIVGNTESGIISRFDPVMYGGAICGNIAPKMGGGVQGYFGGSFTMYGGRIYKNTAPEGGGVALDNTVTYGKFTMYGGEIYGNTAESGGGVYSDYVFDLHGGRIYGNTAENGGGVFIYKGTFTMYDGAIYENVATESGGGVYMDYNTTFAMNGGTISQNTAKENGGGVALQGSSAVMDMTGGEIVENTCGDQGGGIYVRGTLQLSGTPVVRDNVKDGTITEGVLAGGTRQNVYLYYGSSLVPLTVTGALEDGACVGVTSGGGSGTFAQPDGVNVTELSSYVDYFFADNDKYLVNARNGSLRLSTAYEVHFDKNHEDSTGTMESVKVLNGDVYILPECEFQRPGYQFAGWSKTSDGPVITDDTIHIYAETTLYAIWEPLALTGTVTITGTAAFGETLTATVTDTNNTGILQYQWYRGEDAIAGAIDGIYVLLHEDIDQMISCVVSSTEQTGTIASEATEPVAGLTFAPEDVTSNGYNGTYDGQGHQIVVTAPEGAVIRYKTDVEGQYGTENPAYKNAGTYTVYYRVEKNGYYPVTGSAIIAIGQKEVTILDATVESSKIYDGTLAADITSAGRLSVDYNDGVTIVAGAASYADKNVGKDKLVTFSGFTLGGDAADNYILLSQPADTTADITARELLVAATVADKQYDGCNTARFVSAPEVAVGLIEGDEVILHAPTPVFTQVTVGDDIAIQMDDFTITGADSSNYVVVQPVLTASIYNEYTAVAGVDYTVNSNDWINEEFVITAAEGYELSLTDTADGQWSDVLTREEETASGSITFYVRNISTGAISKAVTEMYKIDKTAPVISGAVDGSVYYGDQTITVTESHLNEVMLDGIVVTLTDGALQIPADNHAHTIQVTDLAGNEMMCTITVYKIYTVTFVADGQIIATKPVNHGADLAGSEFPEIPAKEGHDQTAPVWTSGGQIVTGLINVTSDMRLTAVYIPNVYQVILPAMMIGYNIVYNRYAQPEHGSSFSFQVEILDGYAAGENFKVSVNGTEVTAVAGVYTVPVIGDLRITVEGVEEVIKDTTPPVIVGVEDGATYYITRTVTITDENLASVTVNGEPAEATFQLTNDVEQNYIIVATDEAGNQTTVTVIMKPVEDVSADIADITTEDITSEDIQEIQDVIDHIEELLEQEDLTPEDREALEEQKQAAEDLLAQLEAAEDAAQTEAVEQAREILQGEPDQDDKEVLEQAKEDLEEALENYGDNYTEEEKEEILDLIARIDEALEELKSCDGGEDCPSAPYTDLDSTEWYHTYVDYVIEHGLMTGTSATTFKPYDTIDRASMVTILYRISGEQNTATPEEKAQWIEHLRANMTDVKRNSWYEEPIAWAYYKGVTSGTSATTFAPEGVITREQFVLFLYKFSNYLNKETEERADLTFYPDYQSVSDWAVNGVSWGVATGLLTGKGQPDGTSLLAPQGEASRAEAATLIARFHQR